MSIDSYGITIYNKGMKRGASPSEHRTGARPQKGNEMKNANAMNAIRAIMESGDPTDGREEMVQIIDSIMVDGAAPTIMLLVAGHNGETADFVVGCGSTLARAYRRVDGALALWGEKGRMVTAVYAGVLVPDTRLGATYRTCCLYTYDRCGLPFREIERMAGGKADDIDGKSFTTAASALYWCESATEEEMERNTAAINRIDQDAHAAQMWFSRHYGKGKTA